MKYLISFCFTIVFFLSVSAQDKMSPQDYIEKYKALAVVEMHRTGIPASITMAQGLLESGNGNSRLAVQGNNHFGIKCKKTWTGKTIIEDDDEKNECFRAYDSVYLSYIDHSEFLMGNPRYAFLFELDRKDYKGWAHGLKKAGYATNPQYPTLLTTIIERHELHKLDHLTLADLQKLDIPIPVAPKENEEKQEDAQFVYNNIPSVRVQPGDNIVTVAKRHEMGAWQIKKYNDLPKDYTLTPGEVIYLKPKKRKGSVAYHVVKPGETMWSISQLYGIKLKHLYRKNHLDKGEMEQPAPGQTLYLQEKNPKELQKSTEPGKTPDDGLKVVLPANPPKGVDTLSVPKDNSVDSAALTPKEKKTSPVLSDKPSITAKEARDTFNIPREKSDVTSNVELHVVQPGETMFSISKRYNISVEQIRELNNLPDYSLKAGQELIINRNIKEKQADTKVKSFVHEVKQGETLYGIAKKYNMTVEELKTLNNMTDNTVSIGQKLVLSKGDTNKPTEVQANEIVKTHTVAAGETLYGIARKYNISVEELKRLNGLKDNAISIGQVLKLVEN